MSETSLYGAYRRGVRLHGIVKRVENSVDPGTPDTCCALRPNPLSPAGVVTSWVELKQEDAWPARPATPLRLKRFTLGQVTWLEEWHAAGGRCALLLQVRRDFLLLPPWELRLLYMQMATREHLWTVAAVRGSGRFPAREAVAWLTR